MHPKIHNNKTQSLESLITDISVKNLIEVVVQRTSGETICFTDRNPQFIAALQKFSPAVPALDIASIDTQPLDSYQYLILMEVIENFHKDKALKLLETCWNLLKFKGRMMIIAPNESAYQHPHQIKTVSRKSLKSLLKNFGSPKIIMQQPYKWLVMYVIKKRHQSDKSLSGIRKRFEVLAGLCSGKVLELGCGRGELTHEINLKGLDVTGIDINFKKIEIARKKYPDITFLTHDILTLPFHDQTFDTVLLPEILEHVTCETSEQILNIAWRLLNPSGRLIVSVPNENCIPHPNHLRIFTRQSLSDILSPYGNPILIVDQPYKWLIMCIDKPSGD